jgi:feruloyl-CoA synthase
MAKEIAGDPSLSGPEAIVASPKVREFVQKHFAAHNKDCGGSSGRIKRVILMTEPPSVDGHEITDKGYINQRATMERRHELVDKLFQNPPPPEVIEIP